MKLKMVMKRFILDDEKLGWPKLFTEKEVALMDRKVNKK
jgi:hypothetical protein